MTDTCPTGSSHVALVIIASRSQDVIEAAAVAAAVAADVDVDVSVRSEEPVFSLGSNIEL